MNPYNYYLLNGMTTQLKKCENPDRARLTSSQYCCSECAVAHQNGYEVHEGGVLGHSDGCNARHAQRKGLKPI